MVIWFLGLNLVIQLSMAFASGIVVGLLLMNIFVIVKNKKINIYQRQLEKESITANENSARVRILEQKIEVLEKALENALKKD